MWWNVLTWEEIVIGWEYIFISFPNTIYILSYTTLHRYAAGHMCMNIIVRPKVTVIYYIYA